jgi:cytochrome c-type biogenesis protein CcmH
MALFSLIAGLLAGVAATLLAPRLWRTASALAPGRVRYRLVAGIVASFALVAGIIYLTIGSRHPLERRAVSGAAPAAPAAPAAMGAPNAGSASGPANGPAKSMQDAVAGLEARLARDGGSPGDWTLLAQAYDFMGRPDDARRARAKAGTASPAASSAAAGPATGAPATAGSAAAGPAVWQMTAGALSAAAAAADTGSSARASVQGAAAEKVSPPPASASDLERRVAANPRDAQSWVALAELRRGQHDYAGARSAYLKVVEMHAMSAQSWADYADVLGSLAGGSLAGDAGRAIDSAIALDPANPKALWLKASQANEQRRYSEALSWWQKLRAELPADSPDARMVDANIAEARSLAGQGPAPSSATAAVANAPAGAEVSGTVSLDKRFSDRVQSDATLFIYAKAPDSPGPPLAVLRTTVAAWPVNFRLDDSMAMIPSRRLSQFDRVVIEARISRSGQATPTSGDLYVTSPVVHPAPGTRLALVINREIG